MPKVQIRVTDEERERLRRLAAETGMSMSAFVKQRVFGTTITVGADVLREADRNPGALGDALDALEVGRVRPAMRAEAARRLTPQKPYKCPVCAYRTDDPKRVCPLHRQPVSKSF